MRYTEPEIRFLLQRHTLETAAKNGVRTLQPAEDLRSLGCPAYIVERVLADRERRIGKAFQEFRSANANTPPGTSAPIPSLAEQVESSRLF